MVVDLGHAFRPLVPGTLARVRKHAASLYFDPPEADGLPRRRMPEDLARGDLVLVLARRADGGWTLLTDEGLALPANELVMVLVRGDQVGFVFVDRLRVVRRA